MRNKKYKPIEKDKRRRIGEREREREREKLLTGNLERLAVDGKHGGS